MSKNTAEAMRLVGHANQGHTSQIGATQIGANQIGISGDHPRHPRLRETRADDRIWASQLRARHGDLISRYAQRRLGSPEQADQVAQAVFAQAAANRAAISGPALPWLIAAARTQCAQQRKRLSAKVVRRAV